MFGTASRRGWDLLSVIKIARYYGKNSPTLPNRANVDVNVRDERVKWMELRRKHALPDATTALPGRATAMPVTQSHEVLAVPLQPPFPAGMAEAMFGMGCFGVLRGSFGGSPVFTPRPSAMPGG